MNDLTKLLLRLRAGQPLARTEVQMAAGALAAADVPESDKAEFLRALSDKGETPEEVAALAEAFRERAVDPGLSRWSDRAFDIVGTGGDHAGGFNISSLVVLTLACAGVPVIKHGNRGVTSKCGSADLFAALGVNLTAPPAQLDRALEQLGFAFLFAPNYHPAFKHVVPVRKLLAAEGRRTVFNILGPLINPARPRHMLLGCFAEAWVPRLATTLEAMQFHAGLVVYGRLGEGRGIDELTTASENRVRGCGRLRAIDATWRAEDFGLAAAPFGDLVGGDVAANLALANEVVAGRGPRGLVDTVVLNVALALWIAGRTRDVPEGLAPAREWLVGGAVRRKIDAVREFYRA